MKKVVLTLILLMALPSFAAASEMNHFFEGVRPLGMGGAFTAVADDENALFYNPAGLAKVESWGMALANPLIESSESNLEFYEDYDDTDTDSTAEVLNLLRDYMGQNSHFRGAVFPHVVMKNFAIGILGQGKGNIKIDNPAYPELNVEAMVSVSGHMGYSFSLLEEKLLVGVGAKYMSVGFLNQSYTADDIASSTFDDDLEDDLLEGSGFGFDLGVMYKLPLPLKPTLGLTVLNVGEVDLADDAGGAVGTLPQQINAGVSVATEFGEEGWIEVIGAADYMDITNELSEDDDMYKRLHFGVEAKIPVIAVRAGIYQGYGSFGATVDFKLIKLDYANYASEVGSYAGSNADRRHVVQLSLGW